ncbi:hypothetical protein DFH09DRAFT_1362744, partial [Mycena vulgaris]
MPLTLSVEEDDIGEGEFSALSVSSSAFASPAGPSPASGTAPPLARKTSLDSRPLPSSTESQRPRALSRSHTLPRVPQFDTKSRRKNSELDSLVVEPDVLVRIRRWILGVAIVDFDVDDGPVISRIYPPLVVFPAEAENIAFSAFPDSPQFEDGSQDHSFCIRDHALSLGDRRPAAKDGFIYGFAHFTQRKDSSTKRGYEQRSLVILTHHPYPAFFARITALLGPLFQEHGLPMLEAACHNIATWSDPIPGMIAELGFLGTVLTVELPHSPEQQQLAGQGVRPVHQHILASSCAFTPPPLLLFEAALSHLWSLWECLVPLRAAPHLRRVPRPDKPGRLVAARPPTSRCPSPATYAQYFTIHDTDHAALASRLPPAAGRVPRRHQPCLRARVCALAAHPQPRPARPTKHGDARRQHAGARGAPNPGGRRARTNATSPRTARSSAASRPPARGAPSASASPCRSTCGGTSTRARQELLVPPARYLHTLIPTPAERAAASASASEPLRMRAFSAPAFLESLKTGAGAALPFRSTARRREFYERWLRTPGFGVWLGMQEGIVQGVLGG